MRKLIIFCIILCLLLTGCNMSKVQTRTVFAMDTVMELTVYSDSDTLMDEIENRISDLEGKLSVTKEDSDINILNTKSVSNLSEDTRRLITESLELCESTDGALDISVYPAVAAWGFTTGENRIPSQAEIDELLEKVDYTKIWIKDHLVSVPLGMQIDLGSVAKGYTGDVICAYLRVNGVSSALLNLGGNVQAFGSKPDGSDWSIAIQHPTEEAYLGILEISDKAVITSGGYERYFVGEDGETYCHIIDPETGRPSDSGLVSVTIVGERGLVCDALSTALFVMGLSEATEFWRSGEYEFEAVFVTEDGGVYITEGLEDNFTLGKEYEKQGLTVIER